MLEGEKEEEEGNPIMEQKLMCQLKKLLFPSGSELNHYMLKEQKTIFFFRVSTTTPLSKFKRALLFFIIIILLPYTFVGPINMSCIFGNTCSKIRVKSHSSSLETMSYNMRAWVVTVLVVLVASNAFICDVNAAGECGKTPIRSAAASLSPCLGAAGNARAAVPPACCSKVAALLKTTPKCLCAVLLSPLAKQAGIKPGIAITIPKRCSIKNRQAGKKCGSK
jgi:hypothetical protein